MSRSLLLTVGIILAVPALFTGCASSSQEDTSVVQQAPPVGSTKADPTAVYGLPDGQKPATMAQTLNDPNVPLSVKAIIKAHMQSGQ